jgi:hypothetical protein
LRLSLLASEEAVEARMRKLAEERWHLRGHPSQGDEEVAWLQGIDEQTPATRDVLAV